MAASRATQTLRVMITGDARSLNRELQGSESRFGRFGSSVVKVGKVVAAGLAATGAAAVAGAFKTAAYGDELDKTSAKLGINTDLLQDLNHWASQNGISSDALNRAVGRLNQRIGRAVEGNDKYRAAFEDLDVAIVDTQGNTRDTEEVMRDTIDALSAIEDPALQSAAASEVFGTKMARDLMPALRDGSLTLEEATAAMDKHGRMTEEQIEASVRFTDSWDAIKTAGGNLIRQGLAPVMEFMADRLFPVIQDVVIPALQRFGDWLGPKLKAAGEVATAAFDAVKAWWDNNSETILGFFRGVRDTFDDVVAAVDGFIQNTLIPAFKDVKEWWDTEGEAFRKRVVEIFEDMGEAWDEFTAGFKEGWEESRTEAARSEGSLAESWARLRRNLGLTDRANRETTEGMEISWRGFGRFLGESIENDKRTLQEGMDKLSDMIEFFRDGIADLRQGWHNEWSAIRRFFAQTTLNVRTDARNFLDTLIRWFVQLPGDISRAVGDVGRTLLQKGKDLIKGLVDGMKERIKTIGSDIGKALGAAFEKAFSFIPGIGDGIGIAGTGAVSGWQRQWAAVQGSGVGGLNLMSAFRPGSRTRSGNLSYHARGRAVDVGGTPGAMAALSRWIAATFGGNTKELIYSGPGGVNLLNGRPHRFSGGVRSDHFDHVHWAMRQGAFFPRDTLLQTTRLAEPGTGGEWVLPDRKLRSAVREESGTGELAPKLDKIIGLLERGALGDVNIATQAANPVEVAQALTLALRMR